MIRFIKWLNNKDGKMNFSSFYSFNVQLVNLSTDYEKMSVYFMRALTFFVVNFENQEKFKIMMNALRCRISTLR